MKFSLQFYDSVVGRKRKDDLPLIHHSFHPTFQLAVLKGQQVFGYGLFHVECPPAYVPSRAEQLLIESEETKTQRRKLTQKKQHLLNTL